jgi:hypothetical protein
MRSTLAAILLFAVASTAVPVHASQLRYTFENVVFDDGGTLTGSFVYDFDTLVVSSINVQTTAGSSFGGAAYAQGVAALSSAVLLATEQVPPAGDLAGETVLALLVLAPLEGFTTALDGTLRESRCPDAGLCLQQSQTTLRTVSSGSLVSSVVPLPPALPLMLTGVAALAGFRRRLRR